MGADLVSKAFNLARSILTWHLHKLNQKLKEQCLASSALDDQTSLH
jgi:hypothetical protein